MPNKRGFNYFNNCVGIGSKDVPALHQMIDRARDIKWETLIKHIRTEQVRSLFPDYEYNGNGLHIKDDWAVSFCKSRFRGKVCYYIRHSAIEYIFLR